MSIGRWNYNTHEYDPFTPPTTWRIALYSTDMDQPINCTNCGRDMLFGNGFTSREIHNDIGLGYPVCADCYAAESKLKSEHEEASQ